MGKLSKIGATTGICTATLASIHLINKYIFQSATSSKLTASNEMQTFNWKLGNISYTVSGHGAPLLLIHELKSDSSSYEWSKVVKHLEKRYQVYTIDLLGCGNSDKPECTYTTYMYTQLINDFVLNVISKKVNVIATGNSVSLILMSAYNNPYLFNKIIMVNPESVKSATAMPDKYDEIRKKLIDTPIIGTLLYNILVSRHHIQTKISNNILQNSISKNLSSVYYENAHLSGASSKYLYASVDGHYMTAAITHAVQQLDNCIYIISGIKETNSAEIITEYEALNPAIETKTIDFAKHLPQYEQPADFSKVVSIILG